MKRKFDRMLSWQDNADLLRKTFTPYIVLIKRSDLNRIIGFSIGGSKFAEMNEQLNRSDLSNPVQAAVMSFSLRISV